MKKKQKNKAWCHSGPGPGGLQRAQAYYHPPARGALIPFCEDRQWGSAFWSLSAATPPPEYLGGASPEKMLQGGAGPLTSELQLGRVAGPLQASGTSMDGKRKAEMCQQTHPRTKMLEIPRVLTCNSQDPPSLLPAPLKASSGCSGERWDAGPWAQPSSEPPLQAGGRGWGSTCGREKGLWGQNLSVVSAQLKRKNEQLVLDLPWYPRPPGQYPGGGARGRLSLSPPPPPLPLAEDTKSSRKEILLSLFQVFFFFL